MTYGKWTWAVGVAILGGAMLAADGVAASSTGSPATQPTTMPAGGHAAGRRRGFGKPWSEMRTLTPKQEDQIVRINEDLAEQKKKMEQKAHDDIVALLTPEQQSELHDVEGSNKATKKEKSAAARKRREAATTRPIR